VKERGNGNNGINKLSKRRKGQEPQIWGKMPEWAWAMVQIWGQMPEWASAAAAAAVVVVRSSY
jgi:negative regulator of sigma E activity